MKIVRYWLLVILLLSTLSASESSGIALFGGFESKPEKGRIRFSNTGYELSQILKDGAPFIKPKWRVLDQSLSRANLIFLRCLPITQLSQGKIYHKCFNKRI